MLLNYHIGRFILVSLCVLEIWCGWFLCMFCCTIWPPWSFVVATAPNLQHTAKQEQNDQCGNSTA